MRKYFNILLVLVAVLAVSMVACKKAPTAIADFSTEEVSPPPAPSDEVKNEMIFNVSGSGTSYNLTPESKDYNIVIGGDVVSVGDAKATFKDGGYLTIVFKWGGSYAETTFTVKSK